MDQLYPAPHVGRLPGTRMISYAYPLRQDFTARLVLPDDLTKEDVARLRAFMESLEVK
jgi:hypothetical protein